MKVTYYNYTVSKSEQKYSHLTLDKHSIYGKRASYLRSLTTSRPLNGRAGITYESFTSRTNSSLGARVLTRFESIIHFSRRPGISRSFISKNSPFPFKIVSLR